jgi:hypothetical protein
MIQSWSRADENHSTEYMIVPGGRLYYRAHYDDAGVPMHSGCMAFVPDIDMRLDKTLDGITAEEAHIAFTLLNIESRSLAPAGAIVYESLKQKLFNFLKDIK